MARNKPPNPDPIKTPTEAFERMQQEFQAGNSDTALAIADRLIRLARENLHPIRKTLVDAVSHDLQNGKLHQRIWKIDKASGLHITYFSQSGQDRFVEKNFFDGKTDGVFVDIGGYDGLDGSNTLFFEKFRNWKGICIEASPTQFEKMAQSRTAECLNIAVSDFEGEAQFFEITKGYDQMSRLKEDLQPEFLDNLKKMNEGKEAESQDIMVKVTTFDKIAKERNLTHVDYCSIDVEGSEIKVLQGIDFDYTDIRVLSIENPSSQPDNFKLVRDFMSDRGYQLVGSLGVDDIFAKG
jgi:FkbM family methyltransferase